MPEKENVVDIVRCAALEMLQMFVFVYMGTLSVAATGMPLSAANLGAGVSRILPIAFTFGMTILVLVYSFGHITGACINPAVTLAVFLVGEMSALRAIAYVMGQLVGAVIGSICVWGSTSQMSQDFLNTNHAPGNPPFQLGANTLNLGAVNQGNGFLLEVMGTFFLCIVVLMTVKYEGNLANGTPSLAPLAIGTTVFIAHIVLIPFTGCGINPARTFGPGFVNLFFGAMNREAVWGYWCWIYYIGPIVGAGLAALVFWLAKKTANVEPNSMKDILRGGLFEFIQMAIFVYFGTGAVLATGEFLGQAFESTNAYNSLGQILPVAFSFGMSILVLVYSFGTVSGSAINPAVSLALFLAGESSAARLGVYTLAQLLGAILGSCLIWASTTSMSKNDFDDPIARAGTPPFNLGANTLSPLINQGNGFFLEMMGTFLLCLVVLMTVKHNGNLAAPSTGQASVAPYAIGYAVFIAHLCLITLTGCGINPARTFGPAVVASLAGNSSAVFASSCWIYYIGPIVGAGLAAGQFRLIKNVKPGGAVSQDEGEGRRNDDEESEPLLEESQNSLGKA